MKTAQAWSALEKLSYGKILRGKTSASNSLLVCLFVVNFGLLVIAKEPECVFGKEHSDVHDPKCGRQWTREKRGRERRGQRHTCDAKCVMRKRS